MPPASAAALSNRLGLLGIVARLFTLTVLAALSYFTPVFSTLLASLWLGVRPASGRASRWWWPAPCCAGGRRVAGRHSGHWRLRGALGPFAAVVTGCSLPGRAKSQVRTASSTMRRSAGVTVSVRYTAL